MNSSHNQGATYKITKDVIEAGECSCRDSIACKMMVLLIKAELLIYGVLVTDAAKKYHEYPVRQQKPVTEEQRLQARSSRILQRRQRVGIYMEWLKNKFD